MIVYDLIEVSPNHWSVIDRKTGQPAKRNDFLFERLSKTDATRLCDVLNVLETLVAHLIILRHNGTT